MGILYRGIFWIKSIDDYSGNIVIKSKCDEYGDFVEIPPTELLSKTGLEFNHAIAWRTLNKRDTDGKDYNYYPRGRIQIKNRMAIIYANGNIANSNLVLWAKDEFALTVENGIESIVVKADMSNHYLCYLDRE